jgi:hypothetical protein
MPRRACYRLAVALVELSLRDRERDGVPKRILLDLDGTDDPPYGAQEGTAYHACYGQHMYHPLLIVDGDTDQLICAVLRPGNAHVSRGVVAILKRLLPVLKQRWPGVQIALRADSGCATPTLYDRCEPYSVQYTIGLVPNARLKRLAEPVQAAAEQQHQEQQAAGTLEPEKVRTFGETLYQAEGWKRARRVVIKAELLEKGPNVRFVVTNQSPSPQDLYEVDGDRGAADGYLKDLKTACSADRLSCHSFWATQFRLLLHGAAYWLLDRLQRWLMQRGGPRLHLDTLRLKLVKIGGRVMELAEQVRLRLASSHPGQVLWRLLAAHRFMNNPG